MNEHRPEESPPSGIPHPDGSSAESDPPVRRHGVVGRRLVHATLAMILLVPVVIWLANAGDQTDVIGENTVDLGDDAPSFTVDLFGGGHFSLEDHLSTDGRPVVLNFWASWCVPCREEMPAFDTVAQRRPDVLFIGVAVQDSAESAMAFADEVAVSYPLGLDDDGQILELYPILGLPTTTLITGNGNIATTWSGQLDAERLESLIDEHLTP